MKFSNILRSFLVVLISTILITGVAFACKPTPPPKPNPHPTHQPTSKPPTQKPPTQKPPTQKPPTQNPPTQVISTPVPPLHHVPNIQNTPLPNLTAETTSPCSCIEGPSVVYPPDQAYEVIYNTNNQIEKFIVEIYSPTNSEYDKLVLTDNTGCILDVNIKDPVNGILYKIFVRDENTGNVWIWEIGNSLTTNNP